MQLLKDFKVPLNTIYLKFLRVKYQKLNLILSHKDLMKEILHNSAPITSQHHSLNELSFSS